MKTVRVAAAVICNAAERPAKVFATARGYGEFRGRWEFPGGKIEPGETARQALVREIREELSVTVEPLELLGTIEYDYPGFHLSMDCFACALREGEIVLREALEGRWLGADELAEIDWLPADRELLGALHALLETPSPRDLERLDRCTGGWSAGGTSCCGRFPGRGLNAAGTAATITGRKTGSGRARPGRSR